MGMFDTLYFKPPIACTFCQAPISSTQTKALECLIDEFRIGDCIGHAEELRRAIASKRVLDRVYANGVHSV